MMKKIVSLLLAASILTTLFVGVNLPIYATASGDYEYAENGDGTVTLTGYNGEGGNVEIPAELDGMRVTGIGEKVFQRCDSLTSVDIPDSVANIGNYAFESCRALAAVKLPEGVTSIGEGSFRYCDMLTSIDIPASVAEIGMCAFDGCPTLTDITVNSGNLNYSSEGGVLFNKTKTELVQYPIGNSATEYSIPDGVTSVGYYSFDGCDLLTSVTIPHGVASIKDFAFSDCDKLTVIAIPDSVTEIGYYAFAWCKSLTEVTVPVGVTTIEYGAFEGCGDGLTIYGVSGSAAESYAEENGLSFVEIGQGPTEPDENTFQSGDVSVSVPNGALDDGAQLTVNVVDIGDVNIADTNGYNTESAVAMDIRFVKDGAVLEPTGEVTVSIKAPQGIDVEKCRVLFVDGGGNLVDMNAENDNGCLVFTAGKLGYYLIAETAPKTLMGDVNGDGSVDTFDSLLTAQYDAGKIGRSDIVFDAADVNGDGSVDTFDALLIAQYDAGQIGGF